MSAPLPNQSALTAEAQRRGALTIALDANAAEYTIMKSAGDPNRYSIIVHTTPLIALIGDSLEDLIAGALDELRARTPEAGRG